MGRNAPDLPEIPGVPEFHRAIRARRGEQSAVRTVTQPVDVTGVAMDDLNDGAGFRVPNHKRVIVVNTG